MKGRRLYVLSALALVLACQDQKAPTAPTGRNAPTDPSALISDGAHGGNPDFFFLPPMVSDPSSNPNFEQGKFNAALQPSLTVEICQLQGAPVDAQGLPVVTDCVAGPPVKKFPAGTVRLQAVDPGGFYQVVWNTKQSNLDVTKYYRIKVLIEGASVPLGVADIDPVENMKEFKNARTGEVIPLNDDSSLPIKFRIERGAACNGGLCNSVTVTNTSPTGSTIVTLDEGAGAVAGAKFPNGWLPAGGPQSVVVTIADVNTGASNPATGSETIPCHANLPLEQFRGCFNFSTTPALVPIDESGTQFAIPVTVASCYVLEGTGDPREKFAEMWSSGPNEPPHALPDASDVGILGPNARSCATNVIGLNSSKGVTGLASTGWRTLKGGLSRLFGVQTAYAVDLGLGGFSKGFSNVGPALSALIEPVGATTLTVAGGGTVVPFVRIVGSNHHDAKHQNSIGIGGIPVTFVASAGSTISPQGTEGGTATQLTATTNTLPIDTSSTSGGGYAAVNWTIPRTPGTYTLTANSLAATGGPVTFTVTVPTVIGFNIVQGSLTAGGFHACGRRTGGAAYCWGNNSYGQLGNGTTTSSNRPVPVLGGLTFASLSAGGELHTCGLTTAGAAYCWGSNSFGELGDGTTTSRISPTAVAGGLTFASLTSGSYQTCGLTSGGAAYCWGNNSFGQLGNATTTNSNTPVAVLGGLTFASLSEGGQHHSCGLTTAGAAYCWGSNSNGQLGTGPPFTSSTTPLPVAGGLTFTSLTSGGLHNCALTSTGAAYCWGNDGLGELGDGTYGSSRATPVAVLGGLTFASLTGGPFFHTCGVTTDGAAYCWGYNLYGQLGDGSVTIRPTPTPVSGGLTFSSLSAGTYFTCGTTAAGAAYCWGTNSTGQLGDGTTTDRLTPVAVVNP